MKISLLVGILVMGSAVQGWADRLDDRQVPADAQWLVHVDVGALNSGNVSQKISQLWQQLPATRLQLRQLRWTTGLDPLRDLNDITIYGRSYEPNRAVVIFQTKAEPERLRRYLSRRPGFETTSYGQHELMSWTERRGLTDEHRVLACFYRSRTWVFARDDGDLEAAIDALASDAPGPSQDSPLRTPAAPEGTVIQVRGIGLADTPLPFESPLIRKSSYLIALGGETSREAFATVHVATESEEVANQLRAVVNGLLAMARLRSDKQPEVLRLLDAVQVEVDQQTVTVQFRWPAEDLAKLVEKSWTAQQNPN